ncbi:MAG: gliding motility lipoprotein GldH [Muribaculaceae bacterium]|nr:gliding motility lipoprotein GldH [Muribaculaceae bacterium]
MASEINKKVQPAMPRKANKWLLLLLMAVALFGACAPEERSYGEFRSLPAVEGWSHTMPLVFEPQYADSTATYDVTVGIRHTNAYAYRNVSLMVDLMDSTATVKQRKMINLQLADEYGNWLGTGFGALFQCKARVATAVKPTDAHRVVVWQVMGDTVLVKNVTEVGILIHKTTGR